MQLKMLHFIRFAYTVSVFCLPQLYEMRGSLAWKQNHLLLCVSKAFVSVSCNERACTYLL